MCIVLSGECKTDGFGGDVAISDDGARIIVGSKKGNYFSGTSRVFEAVVGAGDGTDGTANKCPPFTPSSSPSVAPTLTPSAASNESPSRSYGLKSHIGMGSRFLYLNVAVVLLLR